MAITPTGIMLTDIENAIVDRIKTKVEAIVTAIVQQPKGEGPVSRHPSVYAATAGGGMRKIGNNLKIEPTIVLVLKFQDLRKEEDRRKGANPIVLGVIRALFNQDLGLKIDNLLPTRFRDLTDETDRQEGFVVFGIEIKTGFVMNTVDDSDDAANDLITIGLKYYLQPDANSDGLIDAEDDITTR